MHGLSSLRLGAIHDTARLVGTLAVYRAGYRSPRLDKTISLRPPESNVDRDFFTAHEVSDVCFGIKRPTRCGRSVERRSGAVQGQPARGP